MRRFQELVLAVATRLSVYNGGLGAQRCAPTQRTLLGEGFIGVRAVPVAEGTPGSHLLGTEGPMHGSPGVGRESRRNAPWHGLRWLVTSGKGGQMKTMEREELDNVHGGWRRRGAVRLAGRLVARGVRRRVRFRRRLRWRF